MCSNKPRIIDLIQSSLPLSNFFQFLILPVWISNTDDHSQLFLDKFVRNFGICQGRIVPIGFFSWSKFFQTGNLVSIGLTDGWDRSVHLAFRRITTVCQMRNIGIGQFLCLWLILVKLITQIGLVSWFQRWTMRTNDRLGDDGLTITIIFDWLSVLNSI